MSRTLNTTALLTAALLPACLANAQTKRQLRPKRKPPRLPDTVRVERDVPYAGTKNPRQTLDLFLPKIRKTDKPLPVIAFIHGGGWRNGNKQRGWREVIPYVASGQYAGVSIAYRLSGEVTWPAQIHDCKAAVRWIRANAKKYEFDPDRIGVMGTSAGGHLVAMLGTAGDVPSLEGKLGKHTGLSSRVTCVVDFFGPSELLTMNNFPSRINHDAARSPESRLIGGPIQKNKAKSRNASPITHVSKGDAPFLIVHGSKDPLVPFDQSAQLHKRLQSVSVPSILIEMDGGRHGGFRSRVLDGRVRKFFDRHLRGANVEISDKAITATE
ncbi:MAG: alpha/beta hydrolase fold domain-containing protein [Planctomycetaceae bacterium]